MIEMQEWPQDQKMREKAMLPRPQVSKPEMSSSDQEGFHVICSLCSAHRGACLLLGEVSHPQDLCLLH